MNTNFERVVGVVAEMKPFGAIVSLPGNRSGLLHETRAAGGTRVPRQRRMAALTVGASVEVDIIEVKREAGRTKISLSEQWRDDDVLTGLQEGSVVKGEVVHVLDRGTGLIVCIAEGVAAGYDGFVHVTELVGAQPRDRDQRLARVRLGEKLELEVLSVAHNERFELSIKLSEKALMLRRKFASSFAVGTTHTGTVKRRQDDGFVVSFGEFSGFLPDRELGKTSAGSIQVGKGVKTKVLAIEGRSLTLSRREL